ncbi:TraV family lipoprotein [Campylobacter lari]|uniref:TraV family lipoprotein n=1 Tax=Campylobacter lari TaxID=201 RepID=UPI0012705C8D|nr:hypothetical protein [Campylobacter lari]EAK0438943.1 hypothetical protein [Campylobacter lari]EAK0795564.1 hypothetical protein [Campylobacter lari]EAK5583694.1 hypothetical protein [Campylobacter lari]EAK9876451.1 hypothetical protein [Campylobacter lari]
MKNKIVFSTLACAFLFNACAMLPYKNDFSCEKGKNNGTCDSVSNVYELSHDKEELRKRTIKDEDGNPIAEKQENKQIKKQDDNKDSFYDDEFKNMKDIIEAVEIRNIQNNTPTIFRYTVVMTDNDSSKDKTTQSKSLSSISHSTQSTDKTISSAKAISKAKKDISNNQDASKANQGSNQTLSEDETSECFSSSKSEKTILNKEIKVCVYSANIREKPSCKAKVLSIAKEGDSFFALYEQDGWIALSNGSFIHKSIVEVQSEK